MIAVHLRPDSLIFYNLNLQLTHSNLAGSRPVVTLPSSVLCHMALLLLTEKYTARKAWSCLCAPHTP